MELIFEILFELIFEGSLEIGTSKKAPLFVRILAMAVFLIASGGVLILIFLIALVIMKKSTVGGWMLIIFDLFLLGCIIYAVGKNIKKRKS